MDTGWIEFTSSHRWIRCFNHSSNKDGWQLIPSPWYLIPTFWPFPILVPDSRLTRLKGNQTNYNDWSNQHLHTFLVTLFSWHLDTLLDTLILCNEDKTAQVYLYMESQPFLDENLFCVGRSGFSQFFLSFILSFFHSFSSFFHSFSSTLSCLLLFLSFFSSFSLLSFVLSFHFSCLRKCVHSSSI